MNQTYESPSEDNDSFDDELDNVGGLGDENEGEINKVE